MSKSKRGSKENPLGSGELAERLADIISKPKHPFAILQAAIKDDFCNYTFEVTHGTGFGDVLSAKGKAGVIKDSMKTAFGKFNVHMAVIDDAFRHSGIEIADIDMEHTHELSLLYNVTGFKISGGVDNESIVLSGNKFVKSAGGRMDLESPKITLDNLSSYQWYNELKEAADVAREEVALYKEGNYIPVKEDVTEKDDPNQLNIGFENDETEEVGEDEFNDFENAKV